MAETHVSGVTVDAFADAGKAIMSDKEDNVADPKELAASLRKLAVEPADAPLYRFLVEGDTVQRGDEFVDDDCVSWNPPDRWSIGRPYHSAFKTARRKVASGVKVTFADRAVCVPQGAPAYGEAVIRALESGTADAESQGHAAAWLRGNDGVKECPATGNTCRSNCSERECWMRAKATLTAPGVLGTGSAAGHTTAEFSNLSNQAHGYGMRACEACGGQAAPDGSCQRKRGAERPSGCVAAGVKEVPRG